MVEAREDPALVARVVERVALRYCAGPDAALDRPGHVRAGSALARIGDRLVVIQDDAAFVARVHPGRATVDAIPLPDVAGVRCFDEGRGNKAHKLDLEACFTLDDGMLLALGSGSTPARERIVIVRHAMSDHPEVTVVDASRFYAELHAHRDLSGSELNIEGAARLANGRVILLQRGNGAPRDGRDPRDASAEVELDELLAFLAAPATAPVPQLRDVRQYRLGEVAGVRLTFTDAASRRGRVYYLAAAEDSPNTYDDGPVAGVAIGILDPRTPRWTTILDETGTPLAAKAEGLVLDERDPRAAWIVLDRDTPEVPTELCKLELAGPW